MSTTPQLQIIDTPEGITCTRLALEAVQSLNFPVYNLRELQSYKAGADAAQSVQPDPGKLVTHLMEALLALLAHAEGEFKQDATEHGLINCQALADARGAIAQN
jgi:hypothetical protein